MEKLYFRYGNGKSTEICQTAYNYRSTEAKIVVMTADLNKEITSHVETENGEKILTLKTNSPVNKDLFEQGFAFKRQGVSAVLVDNAHMLTPNEVDQLFYLCKVFGITVITYGNRMINGNIPSASMRLMELSNEIEPVDDNNYYFNRNHLKFYYGAMNTGKSLKLLKQAFTLEKEGLDVIVMKPATDRTATLVTSRIGLSRKADIVVSASDDIKEYSDFIRGKERCVILVDEAQFLTPNQINELARINMEYGIPIGCYGLKTDFLTHHFEGSGVLLGIADLEKLRTTCCHCTGMEGAEFNARKYKDGEYITEGSQVAVDDGKEIAYDSLCERCYIRDVQGLPIDEPTKVMKKLMERGIIK